jgi:DNA-binding PadR family transcriptional regulator
LGNFWSFPHTLLYSEPARLESLGLATEARETDGRRRRMFAITPSGLEALAAWLGRPVHASTELRDLGLLQLFFMDLASDEARMRLAEAQLEVHGARLSEYEEHARIEVAGVAREGHPLLAGRRTVEHWRGATLPMGLLYERAAVEFWGDVATRSARHHSAREPDGSASRTMEMADAAMPDRVPPRPQR